MEHFQILATCPHCRVEGAVVELYDHFEPCCLLGVPVESRCRMCERATVGRHEHPSSTIVASALSMADELCPGCRAALTEADRDAARCHRCGFRAWGEQTATPRSLDSMDAVLEALHRWAAEEGYSDAQHLLDASFCDPDPQRVLEALQQRRAVETSFDVLGFLFSHMGGGSEGAAGGSATAAAGLAEAEHVVQGYNPRADPSMLLDGPGGTPPTLRIKLPTGRPPHRRNRALALVSVLAADGNARDAELQFVNNYLARDGLPPLQPDEIRVLRPHEVGPVGSLKDREELCQLMVQITHIDGEKDESEMRVVRDFARAWGVDPARIEAWDAELDARRASSLQRFWMKLRRLFLV